MLYLDLFCVFVSNICLEVIASLPYAILVYEVLYKHSTFGQGGKPVVLCF